MFETAISDDVLRIGRPGTRWLSTGWAGGESIADAAHSITVPDGWECDEIGTYVRDRLAGAGFERSGGPVLLTGVSTDHARGARIDPVEVYATVGLSNPAALPMGPVESTASEPPTEGPFRPGTVNVLVGTTRALSDAAFANLVAVATEAKAATLLSETGFPGTTTDAVVVGCDPDGEQAEYSGSATPVGAAARACVREAVRASLQSRYGSGPELPDSVEDARHGVVTADRAEVFEP